MTTAIKSQKKRIILMGQFEYETQNKGRSIVPSGDTGGGSKGEIKEFPMSFENP